jgi:hypothetical protein
VGGPEQKLIFFGKKWEVQNRNWYSSGRSERSRTETDILREEVGGREQKLIFFGKKWEVQNRN